MLDIELLDPESEVSRDRWWRFRVEVDAHDLPYDPPLPRPLTIWWLYMDPGTRCETWVIRDPNGIAAALRLQLFDDSNQHLAWATVHVRPDVRRHGLGRALYAHALERARAEGRRTLNVGGPRSDAAAEFADAVGAERTQTLLRSVQRLDRLDLHKLDRLTTRIAKATPQYSLVRWVAHCPADYLGEYVHAKNGMLEAPVSDGIDYEPHEAKPDLLRAAEELNEQLGITEYVICARDDTTGEFVGLTQLWNVGGIRAEQGDTTVLPEHRGHRLGVRLKAAMVEWLADVEPVIQEIQTFNDPDNEPMLRVNRELGYRPSELWDDWTSAVGLPS
jgi:RimJ/RimL family protein N-acetyltransferase